MNFLAHFYLSYNEEPLIVGNFIADAVKGRRLNDYKPAIQKGIRLHRSIDDFTDKHPLVQETKKHLRQHHGKYAPVIADVFYDHFLAANWNNYHDKSLPQFAGDIYSILGKNIFVFPLKAQLAFTYMASNNWLANYASLAGIQKALTGLGKRTPYANTMHLAAQTLEADYALYQEHFNAFFPELEKHAESFLQKEI